MESSKRGRRRQQSEAVSAARRKDHLSRVHHNDLSNIDCTCELAAWYFVKRRALGCDCRKRKWGQPRRSSGFGCKAGRRIRIYQGRRVSREWLGQVKKDKEKGWIPPVFGDPRWV